MTPPTSIVGSVEILYLVFNGTLHWSDFIWPFALPTLAGNICGGTFIFALMSHAQIRNDMSNKRKAEALSLIHISEPTRHAQISYAVFCLKKYVSCRN
ncbi:hypothetical protein JMUB7530_27840 [Staphylococcus aureus]